MAWNVQITGPAQKEFQKLPASDQKRVKAALLAMQEDPFSGDVKRLKGQAPARLILVAGILRRTSTTY